MSKLVKFAMYVWSFPVTFFGLVYVLTFWSLGWYKWRSTAPDSLVWLVDEKYAPMWLLNMWKGWAGHAIGQVIVLAKEPDERSTTIRHECKHVDQCLRLGIFQPIIYLTCYLAIKIGCKGSDPYYDNIFEIDSRRAADQIIDVVGVIKKLQVIQPTSGKS
jgi:hypothetical protein